MPTSDKDAELLRRLAGDAPAMWRDDRDALRRIADRLEAHNAELLRVAELVREACAKKVLAWLGTMNGGCQAASRVRAIDLAALLAEREES